MKFVENNRPFMRLLIGIFSVVVLASSVLAYRIVEGEWRVYTIALLVFWFGFFVVSLIQFSRGKKSKDTSNSSEV